MSFKLIDTANWKRYDTFRHFYDDVSCSISMCDDIDVSELYKLCKATGKSFYVSMLYAAASVINAHDEFKMKAVDSPEYQYPMPAVYDSVDIVHNIFHEDDETYTSAFTKYVNDFDEFYENCLDDVERAKRAHVSIPCGDNVFEASCVPWRHFTSVGVQTDACALLPLVCWGRLRENDGRIYVPLSIQVNHASADGFHIARFINETEQLCKELGRQRIIL